MKKVFISLGIILVIAGIVIVGVYGGAKGFTNWNDLLLHDLSKADHAEEFAAAEMQDLQMIEVHTDQFCVYFVQSADENKVSVKYLSDLPKGVEISVTYENKVLKVTQTTGDSVNVWQRIWNGDYLKFFVVIELPNTEVFEKAKLTTEIKQGTVFFDGVNIHNSTNEGE